MTFRIIATVIAAIVLIASPRIAAAIEGAVDLDPVPSFDIPLVFLDEATSTLPVVHVLIQGKPATLLVDTGASVHVIDSKLVETMGVVEGEHVDGKSATEVRRSTLAALPRLTLMIGAFSLQLPGAYATPLAPSLRDDGVDGLLNPERLLPKGTVIVDFARGRLMGYADAKTAHTVRVRWLATHQHAARSPVKGRGIGLLFVGASLGERAMVRTMLDSGASFTTYAKRYVGPVATEGGSASDDVFGRHLQQQRVAQSEHVRIGGLACGYSRPILIDNDIVTNRWTHQGFIGMDVLGKTTILIPPAREGLIYLSC